MRNICECFSSNFNPYILTNIEIKSPSNISCIISSSLYRNSIPCASFTVISPIRIISSPKIQSNCYVGRVLSHIYSLVNNVNSFFVSSCQTLSLSNLYKKMSCCTRHLKTFINLNHLFLQMQFHFV